MKTNPFKHATECCKTGNTQELKQCLTLLDNKTELGERGLSLLNTSLKSGQWKAARLLLQNNFSYCSKDHPAIVSASQSPTDSIEGIELLCEFGFDPNALNIHQRSGLMTSALLGHIHKTKLLISLCNDINAQDLNGNNALIDAVQSNKKQVVELCLDKKPDVNQVNKAGESALMVAVNQKNPNEDVVKKLLEYGFDPELLDNENRSAWLIASRKNQKLQKLINKHLNESKQIELPIFPNAKTSQNNLKNQELTKLEQEPKETIETTIVKTQNPEYSDSPKKIEPIIKIKDESITDIMAEPEKIYKSTKPLYKSKNQNLSSQQEWFLAAKTGNLGQLNRQVIEGIDIDSKDLQGCTALIRASGNKRRAVVSYLLQQKADIESRSDNGSTAMSSSIIGNCRRVAGLLLEKGANPNGYGPSNYNYVTLAAAQWNEGMLSILHRFKADLQVINSSGQNLAHITALAAEHYQDVSKAKATFAFLLDHGIDLNLKDNEGNTPLMMLTGVHKSRYKVNDRNIASLLHSLLKIGASAVPTNHQGVSALDSVRKHKLIQCKGVLMNALSWTSD